MEVLNEDHKKIFNNLNYDKKEGGYLILKY